MSGNKYHYIKQAGSIDQLTLGESSIPKPGRGQVLIKVHASSLNYRDLQTVKGPLYQSSFGANLIPNSDGAGEIVEVGEDATQFKKGDRVYSTFTQAWIGGVELPGFSETALGGGLPGMLTQYRVLNETGVVKIPEHLSYEEASTLTCSAISAWNILFEGPKPLISGQTVLILGTGGVSIHALQFAKTAGATVIITSSSDDKLERAKAMGADHLINYNTNKDWDKKVLEITGGIGVDHVVENGGSGTIMKSINATKIGGYIVIVGFLGKASEEGLSFQILAKAVNVRGVHTGSREMYLRMNESLKAHKIKPVVDKVFKFEEAIDAFKCLESQGHFGKVVIKIA